jgi:hypothetical protein
MCPDFKRAQSDALARNVVLRPSRGSNRALSGGIYQGNAQWEADFARSLLDTSGYRGNQRVLDSPAHFEL